jgi:hypothetical protein
MRAWKRLLDEVGRAQREVPLVARIVRWGDLSRGLTDLPVQPNEQTRDNLVRSIRLPPLRPRRPASPPRLVGEACYPSAVYRELGPCSAGGDADRLPAAGGNRLPSISDREPVVRRARQWHGTGPPTSEPGWSWA